MNTEQGITSSKPASRNIQATPLVNEFLLLTPLSIIENNNQVLSVLTQVACSQSLVYLT